MRALPSFLRPLAVAIFAVGFAACGGPNQTPDAGSPSGAGDAGGDAGVDAGPQRASDAGPDAGPTYKLCAPQGGVCNAATACCGNLACSSGTCEPPAPPSCAAFAAPCGTGQPACCQTRAPDGGWPAGSVPPVLGCFTPDAGQSICVMGGQPKDACGVGLWGCAAPLQCISGSCQMVTSAEVCPRADGGACGVGDDCSAFADNFTQGQCPTNLNSDPCANSGLDCEQTANPKNPTCADLGFTCQEPMVLPPSEFPQVQTDSPYSLCTSQSACAPIPGDTATPVCGSFFALDDQSGTVQTFPVCVESCVQGDDCGSRAWDCVGGECVPRFCYAEKDSQGNDIPGILNSEQGDAGAVSDKLAVLFQPCASPNTVCLPIYSDSWNTNVGICYRVGGADAGGAGASCDSTGGREDLAGLCRSGTLCFKGTCLPWCDTGNPNVAKCPSGETCVAVGGDLVSNTASDNGTGVCTEGCNPYLPASANGCPQGPDGMPPSLCKPAGTDNDVFPSPGVCVGGWQPAIAVGQSCDPFGWVDPCVSGAVCAPLKTGGGYVCAQVCDPQPSPNFQTPPGGCSAGTSCQPLGPPHCENDNNSQNGYLCTHIGACLP